MTDLSVLGGGAKAAPSAPAELVLGTAQWGQGYGITNDVGRLSDETVAQVVECALAAGIRSVDTHRAQRVEQGYGDAQVRLSPWAARFQITTKVFAGSDVPMRNQLVESLGELGTGAVQTCLIHDWITLDDRRAASAASELASLAEEGLCRLVGVAAYDAHDIRRARKHFGPGLALQVPVSVLDQRLVGSGDVERVLVEAASVHVRSVFAQGLLLPHQEPTRWSQHADVLRWETFLKENDLDPVRACLDFVRTLPWARGIVVGVLNATQLREILTAWNAPGEGRDWRSLASADPVLVDPRRWA